MVIIPENSFRNESNSENERTKENFPYLLLFFIILYIAVVAVQV